MYFKMWFSIPKYKFAETETNYIFIRINQEEEALLVLNQISWAASNKDRNERFVWVTVANYWNTFIASENYINPTP